MFDYNKNRNVFNITCAHIVEGAENVNFQQKNKNKMISRDIRKCKVVIHQNFHHQLQKT